MLRRLRRLVLLAILAVAAGAGVLFLTTRPRLDDRRATVERDWRALRPQVDARVDALEALDLQIRKAGPVRDQSEAVAAAVHDWQHATSGSGNLEDAILATNELEGAGRRLLALSLDPHRRYHSLPAVLDAATQYATRALPRADVQHVNTAVARYDDARGGVLRRLVADLLGDDALPRLVVS
jgi:hypothetical protein